MPNDAIRVIVEKPANDASWYIPEGNATWGDLLVVCSLIFGVITWAISQAKNRATDEQARKLRAEDLNWRRTEFLFNQARGIDSDPDTSKIMQVITGNVPSVTIDYILDKSMSMDDTERGQYKHSLDKLLNTMERLAHAVENKAITIQELRSFEWYYNEMQVCEPLKKYCGRWYPSVIAMAAKLVPKK